MITPASGITIIAIRVSSGEIHSIIAIVPITVSRLVTMPPMVWMRVCWMLSMSLVTRESTSPREVRSKYDSGSEWIFSSVCRRRRFTTRSATRTRRMPCSQFSTADTT